MNGRNQQNGQPFSLFGANPALIREKLYWYRELQAQLLKQRPEGAIYKRSELFYSNFTGPRSKPQLPPEFEEILTVDALPSAKVKPLDKCSK